MDESDLIADLQNTFQEEAIQLLELGEQSILMLEGGAAPQDTINDLFRIFHNLKGSARGVGYDQISAFTHHLENLLIKIKKSNIQLDAYAADLILECIDYIRMMLNTLQEDKGAKFDYHELEERILKAQEEQKRGELAEPEPASDWNNVEKAESKQSPGETGLVLFDTEEPESAITEHADEPEPLETSEESKKDPEPDSVTEQESGIHETESDPGIESGQQISEVLRENITTPEELSTEQIAATVRKPAETQKQASPPDETIRVRLSKIEKLNNYVGEMVIMQSVLNQQKVSKDQFLNKNIQQMGKITKEIQDISLELRMAPIKQTFAKMQRIARDTGRMVGKKVKLLVKGEDTEVDKTVLEKINDPLVHIVRNAIDHGLEETSDREKSGKPESGLVELECFHDGGQVIIEVRDDGKGMDPEVIRMKAIEKGVISRTTTFTEEKHVLNLIFHPGFSTKEEASEVSGRGVGMDVVQTNIRELSGDISINSEINKGSVFRISLPLSLSVINGMVASVAGRKYVIPISQVSESIKIKPEDLENNEGIGPVFHLRGQNVPAAFAHEILKEKLPPQPFYTAVIVRKDNIQCYAVLVDEIINQQQIVVKPLSKVLGFTFGLMGSSILGDGMPAFILDLLSISAYFQKRKMTYSPGAHAHG